jgi:hypothetical protein
VQWAQQTRQVRTAEVEKYNPRSREPHAEASKTKGLVPGSGCNDRMRLARRPRPCLRRPPGLVQAFGKPPRRPVPKARALAQSTCGGRTRGIAVGNGVAVTARGPASVCLGPSRDCKRLQKFRFGKSGRRKRWSCREERPRCPCNALMLRTQRLCLEPPTAGWRLNGLSMEALLADRTATCRRSDSPWRT